MVISKCFPCWIVALFFLGSLGHAARQGDPDDEASSTLTVFADTNLKDPRYGSFVQVRRDQVKLEDLPNLHLETRDGVSILDYQKDDPIEVNLFVPVDMNPADEEAFVQEIERRLNQRFTNPVYKVKRSYIPRSIQQETEALGQDETGESRAGMLARWRQKSFDLARRMRLKSYSPEEVDLAVGTIVVGGLKTYGGASLWLGLTGLNRYGWAQAAVAFVTSIFFSRYPTQINKWKAEHQIPYFKDNPLVSFYNHSPFLKTVTINQLIVLGLGMSQRTFSYMKDPTIPSPISRKYVTKLMSMMLYRTPINALGDIGSVELLKKGWLNRRMTHYLLSLFSIQKQLTNAFLFTNRIKPYQIALRMELGTGALVWVASKLLPARNHRLMIMHPDLQRKDRDQIEYVNELRGTLTEDVVTHSRLSELIEKYKLQMERINELMDSENLSNAPAS